MVVNTPTTGVISVHTDDLTFYPILRMLSEEHLAMIDRFYIYNPKLYDPKTNKQENITRVLFWTKEDRVYVADVQMADQFKLLCDPYELPGFSGKGIVEVANGAGFLLARTAENTLLAWGGLYFPELGTGRNRGPEPRPVFIDAKVKMIRCVDFNIGALDTEGNLWMWGQNEYGMLALDMFKNRMRPTMIDESPLAGETIVDLVMHSSTVMVLTEKGQAFAWGKLKLEKPTLVPCDFKVVAIALLDENMFFLNQKGELYHYSTWYRHSKVFVPEPVVKIVSCLAMLLLVGVSGKVYVWTHARPVTSSKVQAIADLVALHGQLQTPGIVKMSDKALAAIEPIFQDPRNSSYQLLGFNNTVLYTTRTILRTHSRALRLKLDADEETSKHTLAMGHVHYPALFHYIRYLPLKTPNPDNLDMWDDKHVAKLLDEIEEIPLQFIELAFEVEDKILYLEGVKALFKKISELYKEDKSKVAPFLDPLLEMMDERKIYTRYVWRNSGPLSFQDHIFCFLMKRVLFMPHYLKRCVANMLKDWNSTSLTVPQPPPNNFPAQVAVNN